MRVLSLEGMKGGWFVGDFDPAALRTPLVEVAVHRLRANTPTEGHFHREATEVNLLLRGSLCVNGVHLGPGNIVVLEPGEVSEATVLTDCELVVVKLPSVPGDKYPYAE